MKIKSLGILAGFGVVGYALEGLDGAIAWMICSVILWWLLITVIEFFMDVFGLFNRPVQHHHYVHHTQEPAGHPDVEGTAVNRDPTIPDEEWVGAITYRLKKGEL